MSYMNRKEMLLKVPVGLAEQLTALAKRERIPRTELILQFCRAGLASWGQEAPLRKQTIEISSLGPVKVSVVEK